VISILLEVQTQGVTLLASLSGDSDLAVGQTVNVRLPRDRWHVYRDADYEPGQSFPETNRHGASAREIDDFDSDKVLRRLLEESFSPPHRPADAQ
jgi:hypothetical protein